MTNPAAGKQAVTVPRTPKTITTTEGKAMWKAIWMTKAEQLRPAQDTFLATLACEITEQINEMKAEIKGEGNTVYINDGKTLVLHPLHKHVSDLQKQVISILKDLGFSPKDRSTLALEAANTAQSSMEAMRNRLESGDY